MVRFECKQLILVCFVLYVLEWENIACVVETLFHSLIDVAGSKSFTRTKRSFAEVRDQIVFARSSSNGTSVWIWVAQEKNALQRALLFTLLLSSCLYRSRNERGKTIPPSASVFLMYTASAWLQNIEGYITSRTVDGGIIMFMYFGFMESIYCFMLL